MDLKPIKINVNDYPPELHAYLADTQLFDTSSSPQAKVIFSDKDSGYFLKMSRVNGLKREYSMTKYYHSLGLATQIIDYCTDGRYDYLLTEKVSGDDCSTAKFLEQPKRLAQLLGEQLRLLHSSNPINCPVPNHTERYLLKVNQNKVAGSFDQNQDSSSLGFENVQQAWKFVQKNKQLLQTDTLLHGDYCLPNTILNDWRFSGFIDLENSGVGDRHVDLFWGVWSLEFNLKTNQYRDYFLDAYGRELIDDTRLRLVAACEVFG